MKNDFETTLNIDKAEKTVKITRKFAAAREQVWDAWTEPELLDRWWAPKPWKSHTKEMDFKEGGHRLYAMVSPEGEKHWSLINFTSITPRVNFKYHDGFCDSDGVINQDLPQSDWNVNFNESDGSTTVHVEIRHEKRSDLEKIMEMGFKEGFTATLRELADVLAKL